MPPEEMEMTDDVLSARDRVALLALARDQIDHTLAGRGDAPEPPDGPEMKAGAFVSLHLAGRLRGCIGNFDTTRPVQKVVREMAVAAATRDPRFPPVTPGELQQVDIEISVLTPPRRVADSSEVTVGEHGVVVSRGYQRGVLLPQVATENGWDRQTFLEHTCLKAGLPSHAWKEEGTVIEVFTAQVFGELEKER